MCVLLPLMVGWWCDKQSPTTHPLSAVGIAHLVVVVVVVVVRPLLALMISSI